MAPKRKASFLGNESSGGQHPAGKRGKFDTQTAKASSSGGQHLAGKRGKLDTQATEASSSGGQHSADCGGSHPATLERRLDQSSGIVQPAGKSNDASLIDRSAPSKIVQPEITISSGAVQPAGGRNDADHVDGSGPSSTVQPVVNIKDITIPQVLKPLARSLAYSINAFGYTGIDQEENYSVSDAAHTYVEWRRRKGMQELDRTSKSNIYRCFQGLLAVYHPDVEVAWFSKPYTRAEEAYSLFCEDTTALEQLGAKLHVSQERALLFLATAVRDRQQADVSAFLPYAQRYINELAAMTFVDFQTPVS